MDGRPDFPQIHNVYSNRKGRADIDTWAVKMRETRAAYGISQNKLAVMASVSRTYLNQLENGTKTASDELKEKIDAVLERFNPEKPMTLMIDYLRVRFPTTDVYHVVHDVLRLKLDYLIHEEYGFFSYPEHYHFGDIFVLVAPEDEKMGVLLELRGRGCRQFETYLFAQQRSWFDFFSLLNAENAVYKRVDLAVNDLSGLLDIPMMIDKCYAGECDTIFRSFDAYRSGELMHTREDEKAVMGNTLYIGSKKSDVYFCIYEKDYEQYAKRGIPIEDTEIKNRFEVRLANDRAAVAVDDLLAHHDEEATVFGIINRYVSFKDKVEGKDKRDWPVNKKWAVFCGEHRNRLKLTMQPEPYSFDKTMNWLYHQVASTLKVVDELDKIKGTEVLSDLVSQAVLKDKHEKLVIQLSTEAGDVIV